MTKLVTRESVIKMLKSGDSDYIKLVVGKALVALFNRQNEDEQISNQTTTTNLRGFTSSDAHSGCITAKYYLKNKTLQDWMVKKWVKKNVKGIPRIAKYHAQLNEVALARRTKATNEDLAEKQKFAEYEQQMEQKAFELKYTMGH